MKQKEKESSGNIENPKVSVSDLAERRALLRVRLFLVVNQKIDDGRKKAKRKQAACIESLPGCKCIPNTRPGSSHLWCGR
jgi:glycerol-3-phosphate responsive antiterminator